MGMCCIIIRVLQWNNITNTQTNKIRNFRWGRRLFRKPYNNVFLFKRYVRLVKLFLNSSWNPTLGKNCKEHGFYSFVQFKALNECEHKHLGKKYQNLEFYWFSYFSSYSMNSTHASWRRNRNIKIILILQPIELFMRFYLFHNPSHANKTAKNQS